MSTAMDMVDTVTATPRPTMSMMITTVTTTYMAQNILFVMAFLSQPITTTIIIIQVRRRSHFYETSNVLQLRILVLGCSSATSMSTVLIYMFLEIQSKASES